MKLTINTLVFFFCFTTLNAQYCKENIHSTNANDSWLSCQTSTNPNPARSAGHWVLYDLGYTYNLGQSTLWNYNIQGETGQGMKDIIIDYSINGTTWTEVSSFQLLEASGLSTYEGELGPNFGGISARYVLISSTSTWNNSSCTGLSELKIEIGAALPLDLLSFTANPLEKSILLKWESENEMNFDNYDLERSEDGIKFDFIERVNANGGNFKQQYSYNDKNIKANILYYYRLKMNDLDNSFKYSDIVTASINDALKISISPNPTSDILNINMGSNGVKEIIIQGTSGYEMMRLKGSELNSRIDVSYLPDGVYLLNFVFENKGIQTRKFVKVR